MWKKLKPLEKCYINKHPGIVKEMEPFFGQWIEVEPLPTNSSFYYSKDNWYIWNPNWFTDEAKEENRSMNFIEMVKQLGFGQVAGMEGTDWSWYYKWGRDGYGEAVLITEEGKPAVLGPTEYLSTEWIIKDKEDLFND